MRNQNRDGVEYNTEIVLIVERNHATTLAQPLAGQTIGFLESQVNNQVQAANQGLEKMQAGKQPAVGNWRVSIERRRMRIFFTFENTLAASKE